MGKQKYRPPKAAPKPKPLPPPAEEPEQEEPEVPTFISTESSSY